MGHPYKFQWVLRLGSVTARHHSSGRQANFAVLNRGRHLCSVGRPSGWALAHILVYIYVSDIKIFVRVLMNQDSRTTRYIFTVSLTPPSPPKMLITRGSYLEAATYLQIWRVAYKCGAARALVVTSFLFNFPLFSDAIRRTRKIASQECGSQKFVGPCSLEQCERASTRSNVDCPIT